MRIKFGMLINHEVVLKNIEPADMAGTIRVNGTVNGKPALLTMDPAEGLKWFKALKEMDIEGLALVHGDG